VSIRLLTGGLRRFRNSPRAQTSGDARPENHGEISQSGGSGTRVSAGVALGTGSRRPGRATPRAPACMRHRWRGDQLPIQRTSMGGASGNRHSSKILDKAIFVACWLQKCTTFLTWSERPGDCRSYHRVPATSLKRLPASIYQAVAADSVCLKNVASWTSLPGQKILHARVAGRWKAPQIRQASTSRHELRSHHRSSRSTRCCGACRAEGHARQAAGEDRPDRVVTLAGWAC